jgi:hypothetical protein
MLSRFIPHPFLANREEMQVPSGEIAAMSEVRKKRS